MRQPTKGLKLAIVGGIGGIVAAVFLGAAIVQFSAPAEATPALAKGKPCGTCHTSSKPSKTDVKQSRSKKKNQPELWPDLEESAATHVSVDPS